MPKERRRRSTATGNAGPHETARVRVPLARGASSLTDAPGLAAKRVFLSNLHVLWLPAVLLLAGLFVSYQAAVLHHHSQRNHLRGETSAKLEPVRSDLSRNTFAAAYLTEGLASQISINGELSRETSRRRPPIYLSETARSATSRSHRTTSSRRSIR